MLSISQHVGRQIKFYRKLKKLSLDQLSAMIHKSKSTLSKYENGMIAIDVETLLDIAKALEIEVSQLIDYQYDRKNLIYNKANPFCNKAGAYIYYYDGRKHCVVNSYLRFLEDPVSAKVTCMFYMDIPSFEEYEKCQFYYVGEMNSFDLVTYLTLKNQANPMEQMGFCILNTFHYNSTTWGFMFGISYQPISPFALKFLLSIKPLPASELTPERLLITKSELKIMKTLNMMLLYPEN